jgi:hypothetical protein
MSFQQHHPTACLLYLLLDPAVLALLTCIADSARTPHTAQIKLGYTTLEFAPHLDDGTTQGAWRNGLIFDPLVPYKGHSYVDIMLAPLANALAEVLTPDITVYFAMQVRVLYGVLCNAGACCCAAVIGHWARGMALNGRLAVLLRSSHWGAGLNVRLAVQLHSSHWARS